MPLASFDLASADGPLRSLQRLEAGARVSYSPHALFAAADADKSDAEVALISIPTTPTGVLGVLEVHKANAPAEWTVPSRAAAVALAYGPQGLNLGKLAELVRRDPQLIGQLALYAETSQQTELLMEAVGAWERQRAGAGGGSGGPAAGFTAPGLEAALQGLSSRAGLVLPALDRNASPDQQALVLMRALHPALATIDPLAPSHAQRVQQSAGLAAAVASLFFGNTVGMASAGGAMFLNLRSLFFPGSEFRSALAHQTAADGSAAYILCSKRDPVRSRTRPVYLWATRIQGVPPPRLESLPFRLNLTVASVGGPAALPVRGAHLSSVESWAIERPGQEEPLPAAFDPAASRLSFHVPPGVRKGEKWNLRLGVVDSPAPITIAGAIELLNPRPAIASIQSSLPQEFSVVPAEGELPANSFAALTLRTAALDSVPAVHLECSDPALTVRKLVIRPGETQGAARLRPIGPSAWYLALEPGAVGQPDCRLAARLETADGISDPVQAGRLVRLPRIDKFTLTPELVAAPASAAAAAFAGWIEGEELEGIERTGWNAQRGLPVEAVPQPAASQANRQRLRVAMPWPPPAPRAALYVWLRGESAGRRTTASY